MEGGVSVKIPWRGFPPCMKALPPQKEAWGYATVTLDAEAESILNWAKQERDRQRLREKRIQENPALKKAYEAILRAEENYDLLDKIIGDDHDAGSQVQSSP